MYSACLISSFGRRILPCASSSESNADDKNFLTGFCASSSKIEIDEMINIFHKYANTAPFTYQKINSEGKISYSRTPDVSYGYGIESPEWFAQFICGSTFYGNIDGVNRQAFRNRDYFSALKNLKLIFDKYKFNDIDQNIIIDFFNKYWKKYGMNTQPELVIVREQNNETKAIFEDIYSDNLNIYDVYMNMHDFNSQSENTIDTSNAIYIKMTKYDKISEYINNKKLQNGDIIKLTN